jgi:hypothetical protein
MRYPQPTFRTGREKIGYICSRLLIPHIIIGLAALVQYTYTRDEKMHFRPFPRNSYCNKRPSDITDRFFLLLFKKSLIDSVLWRINFAKKLLNIIFCLHFMSKLLQNPGSSDMPCVHMTECCTPLSKTWNAALSKIPNSVAFSKLIISCDWKSGLEFEFH